MPTSVPAWPTTAPDVDELGRAFAVLSVGEEAHAVADRWCERLVELGRPVLRHRAAAPAGPYGAAVRWADRQARGARAGWRFCVVGPEDEVLLACAAVRAHGAIDAEITAHAVSTARRRVLCTHCRTTTTTTAPVGGTCPCAGCGRTLLVYHHVSRRHAGYMGFAADAEEIPTPEENP
ncbi:dimethylamine monooxygenase subunit DmmA family protein [Kineococcus glutinatus]|uniref:Dimethylamine monooxygenase subunit DmmA-like C-terminal domain-containing protein n=1 Tax=Kineococcus glutinatus TaxID=1070872 RepID=A0ABP9H3B0_9ACTN